MKINKEELEFKQDDVEYNTNDSGTFRLYTFRAFYKGENIGRIGVDMLVTSENKEVTNNSFFYDFSFDLPRPIPYVFGGKTEEDYSGQEIAGEIILFANEYFKSEFGTPLHSGTNNNENAIRVWEKLVERDKAVEIDFERERRWRLL